MKIVWLGIQSSYSHSSLALPLLASACSRQQSLEWELVSGVLGDDAFEMALNVVEKKPDVVCTSLYLFNRVLTAEVLSRIHQLCPDVIMIAGGPECLGEGAVEVMEAMPWLDAVCRGEGENIMPLLMEKLLEGRSLVGVDGVVARNDRGTVVDSDVSGMNAYWSDGPLPCEHPLFDFSKPFVQIETARGCPMGCTYCTSCRTQVRMRDIASVQRELQILHDHGVREIRLLDRTFNQPDERGAALLRMFREQFGDMKFHLEVHPGVLGKAVRQELLLAPKGLLHIETGIQTLNKKALTAVGRSDHVEEALAGLRFLVGNNQFETHCDLLTGLPEQSFDDVISDVEGLVAVGPAEIQMESLKMLPGTVLRHEAAQRKMVFSCHPPYDVMMTPTLSADDMRRCRILSKMLDMFYNTPSLRFVFIKAFDEFDGWVRTLLDWTEEHQWTLQPMGLRRRFDCLNDVLTALNSTVAADELAVAWMEQAFPTSHGPGQRARLIQEIPEHAEWKWGMARSELKKSARLWMLPLQKETAIFAYDRSVAPNRAISRFQCQEACLNP